MRRFKVLAGIVIAIAAALLGYDNFGGAGRPGAAQPDPAPAAAPAADYRGAADRIVEAFANGRGDLWIEAGGVVQRVLSDDSEGSRHQRFIVRLPNDHTVLIAHNIDLAQRVPLKMGDTVSFYGEYEWNERGGVVHWTHHDPRDRREGGWIRHKGTTYR